MCVPNYDIPTESYNQWNELFEQGIICRRCFLTISASRPPVYNPDNCSCVEVGPSAVGNAAVAPVFEAQLYQYNNAVAAGPQQAQSYASSSPSLLYLEGPEHQPPNVAVSNSNSYLELAPALGHNEGPHRRSHSFRSNMPYSLRQFLIEQANMQQQEQHSSTIHPPDTHFLSQEVHIQSRSSMQVNKSSMRSKPSYGGTERLERETFPGFDVDPLTHAGAWASEDGGLRRWDGGAYPAFMGEMYYRDFTA